MVDKRRQKRIENYLIELASEFVKLKSTRRSLITITKATVLPNLTKATFYVSVLPEEFEKEALNFLRRKRPELREFIKKNSKLRKIPFVEIEIDKGEKNRQALEKISSQQ